MQVKQGSKKWYDAYVPFVVRSAESQVAWLVAALEKQVLTPQEITPYIRLLLTEDTAGKLDDLAGLFRQLDENILARMLEAADMHEVPKLFALIPQPTVRHAVIALGKSPAPYEKSPQILFDKVFQALHAYSEALLDEAVEVMRSQENVPGHFETALVRFREIIEDRKLLSSLYPRARVETAR